MTAMTMNWTQQGAFGLMAGEYRIAKCLITDRHAQWPTGLWRYVLYREYEQLGVFETAAMARAKAEEDAIEREC